MCPKQIAFTALNVCVHSEGCQVSGIKGQSCRFRVITCCLGCELLPDITKKLPVSSQYVSHLPTGLSAESDLQWMLGRRFAFVVNDIAQIKPQWISGFLSFFIFLYISFLCSPNLCLSAIHYKLHSRVLLTRSVLFAVCSSLQLHQVSPQINGLACLFDCVQSWPDRWLSQLMPSYVFVESWNVCSWWTRPSAASLSIRWRFCSAWGRIVDRGLFRAIIVTVLQINTLLLHISLRLPAPSETGETFPEPLS